MDRQEVPKTGLQISRLGLGTVQFGLDYGFTKAKTQREVDEILETALRCGINYLDTARAYGSSEAKIGDFLKRHPANGLAVMTKLAQISPEAAADPRRLRRALEQSLDESRRQLGLDSIPLLQLHQTDAFLTGESSFWDVIADLKARKLIEGFGISVYTPAETRVVVERASSLIDLVQLPLNVFDQRFVGLAAELRDMRIAVMSRSAFLRGVIGLRPEQLPSGLRSLSRPIESLSGIAAGSGVPLDALALDFALSCPGVTSTIIGVNDARELGRNVEALGRLEAVRGLSSELRGLAVEEEALIDPRRWAVES